MAEKAIEQRRPAGGIDVQIDQGAILRHLGLNASDPAAQALVLTCQRYGLDPILKHAVLIKNRLYVTRDGLLHVAHRSGQLDGIEVLDQSETQTHFVAKVAVYRKDMARPFAYVGRYPKSGSNKDYGPEMAVKCGEVMALRRAFDVSLAAREEMWDMDVPERAEQLQTGSGEASRAHPEPQAAQPSAAQQAASPSDVAEPSEEPSPVPSEAGGDVRADLFSTLEGAVEARLKRGKGALNEGRVLLSARRIAEKHGAEVSNFASLKDAPAPLLEELIDQFELRELIA